MRKLFFIIGVLFSSVAWAEAPLIEGDSMKPVLEKGWTYRTCRAAGGSPEWDSFSASWLCHFDFKIPRDVNSLPWGYEMAAATCTAHRDRNGNVQIYCCNANGKCSYLKPWEAPPADLDIDGLDSKLDFKVASFPDCEIEEFEGQGNPTNSCGHHGGQPGNNGGEDNNNGSGPGGGTGGSDRSNSEPPLIMADVWADGDAQIDQRFGCKRCGCCHCNCVEHLFS